MNVGRILAWTVVMAMPLWFGSCKKNNGGEIDPVTPNSVEGSWKISSISLKEASGTVDYLEIIKLIAGEEAIKCLTDTKATFKSGGEITGTPSPACTSGGADDYNPAKDKSTWKTNGNKLTITSSEGAETYDYTVSGSTMTWSIQQQDDVDEDGVNEVYTTIIEFKRV